MRFTHVYNSYNKRKQKIRSTKRKSECECRRGHHTDSKNSETNEKYLKNNKKYIPPLKV